MINYSDILEMIEYLNLGGFKSSLDKVIQKANNNEITFLEGLNILLSSQINYKKENVYKAGIKVSHFPFIKTIDDFDFSFQPSISKAQIKDFLTLRFMENNENIIFLGSPGTGKTHLSTSIGLEATRNSKSTYFITCKDLIWQLEKARYENTLERRLKHFTSYSLLIIDELGHDTLSIDESNDLFQLLQMRYEKHSTIITSNFYISEWPSIFKESKTALDATLDRLLHHSNIVNINGPSYRLKGKSEYILKSVGD